MAMRILLGDFPSSCMRSFLTSGGSSLVITCMLRDLGSFFCCCARISCSPRYLAVAMNLQKIRGWNCCLFHFLRIWMVLWTFWSFSGFLSCSSLAAIACSLRIWSFDHCFSWMNWVGSWSPSNPWSYSRVGRWFSSWCLISCWMRFLRVWMPAAGLDMMVRRRERAVQYLRVFWFWLGSFFISSWANFLVSLYRAKYSGCSS